MSPFLSRQLLRQLQMADRSELSDEDQDIDIESDEDDACSTAGITFLTEADKKRHHNALERKRRDHIKDSFTRLRDAIPNCKKEKVKTNKLADNREKTERKNASRAQILKEATEYIQFMSNKNSSVQKDIEQIRKQNNHLKQQVASAESAKANGSFAPSDNLRLDDVSNDFADDSESSDGSDSEFHDRGYKKMKIRHN